MFINDANKIEEIKNIVVHDLKHLGVKYRLKKHRHHVQETKSRKIFKCPLHSLSMETVTLPSGQQLVVPKIVHEMCSFIISKIDTEGLFRKGGSKSRQNEIKLSLDARCYLGDEHHEVDVANVLKTFFRELPEPLIPYSHHELFLRCMILEQRQREAVLLACLLLPTEHLNTLAYFMQFLFRVSEYQHFNRMDSYNLAVVIGPTLLPAEEKIPNNATVRLAKTCELFKMLIENSESIGVISENIIEKIAMTCSLSSVNGDEDPAAKKKKKRRSGSLTRMLSGLKKIVSSKSDESAQTPDLLLTPCLTRSTKKRKVDSVGISNKKRREILNHLPQNAILNTPYTPARTPVSSHPNAPGSVNKIPNRQENGKEKKMLWPHKSKANKKQNEETTSLLSLGTNSIQRRWSAVSTAAGFRRKKTRNSCAGSLPHETDKVTEKDPQIDNKLNNLSEELIKQKEPDENDPNFVRISKVEYEEIKNRVSAIERRISVELDNAMIMDSPDIVTDSVIHNVEKAYEQTLVQAQPLSPTTDQLAKRLSRELKIRRTSENKVIRSPSARKIGSLRRKSKEGNVRLSRNQTWCVTSLTPKTAMKIRKTNTALSGLQNITRDGSDKNVFTKPMNPKTMTTRSSSFNNNENIVSSPSMASSRSISSSYVTNNSSASWKSAQGFFNTPDILSPSFENCRASLAKLRSQNAGMVLAKARLFDNLVDGDDNVDAPKVKPVKIGAPRNLDGRQSYRLRALRMEEKRMGKKSMSPRKRTGRSPGNRVQKLQLARCDGNSDRNIRRIDSNLISTQCQTPKSVPHIKRCLNTKSPRRVCRTPLNAESKQTPLRVVVNNNKQDY